MLYNHDCLLLQKLFATTWFSVHGFLSMTGISEIAKYIISNLDLKMFYLNYVFNSCISILPLLFSPVVIAIVGTVILVTDIATRSFQA